MHDRMVVDDSDRDWMVVSGSKQIRGHVACDEVRSNSPGMSQLRSDSSEALHAAGQLAGTSVSASPLPYGTMARQFEALAWGMRKKLLSWLEQEIAFVQDYNLQEDSGFGGMPASKSFIESLGRLPYGQGEGVREEECVICLEDFVAGAEVSTIPCSHSFHSQCITQWLEKSHLCPICRYHMPTASSNPQGQHIM
uniref:E3 ubiquitin-protein ligase RNF115-like n=1 Tax=Elaeis guineensis var. tenera TaxID=51953 RepID=A0A6J0PR33_ELAGV|nr:E3 ubiquitin-protein ligase RNF115-like [Elaeis guineensis]